MLVNYDVPVDMIKSMEERLTAYDIRCLRKEQENFNIYVFSITTDNGRDLSEVWNPLTNVIANYFQTTLDKEIERWNIYITFIVKERVDKSLKYLIEQNRFSCRKLVMDRTETQDSKYICEFIEQRIFGLNIKKTPNVAKDSNVSIETILKDVNPELLSVLGNAIDKTDISQLLDKYMR